jgi:TolB-like protein
MVADLAILDSDLNKTNLFGRQLSEAILHEVHQTGFTTVDIRSTGFIRITEQGNFFSLSRDYLDFDTTVTANNVVTGTLTRHQGGYLLNARVVALDSRMLIGSSQIFVPFEVVDAVMQEGITSNNENNLMNEAENSERGIPLKAYTSN